MIELAITLIILAILIALAAPGFSQALRNNRIAAQITEFVDSLALARSAAVTGRHDVVICASSDGNACSNSNNWATGWIVRDSATNTLLSIGGALSHNSALTGTVSTVTFDGYGGASANASFTLSPSGCTGTEQRTISTALSGLLSVEQSACPPA